MDYKVKPIKDDIHVLQLSEDEYDFLNRAYKNALVTTYPSLELESVKDLVLSQLIATNGLYRVDFRIEVNKRIVEDQQQQEATTNPDQNI